MLGRPVDLAVPSARARCRWPTRSTPSARAEDEVTAVVLAVVGDLERASCCCSSSPSDAATLCALLGVEPDDPEMALSALGEIGNILGCVLHRRAGRDDAASTSSRGRRRRSTDMLGAIVATRAGVDRAEPTDLALLLDSELQRRGHRVRVRLPVRPQRATASRSCSAGLGLWRRTA